MRSLQFAFLSTGLSVLLALGCTPRAGIGGGGGFDPDASTSPDDTGASGADVLASDVLASDVVTPDMDAAPPPDLVTPPNDTPVMGKDVVSPPADIVTGPTCGDGMCNGTETCTNCARDCGACPPSCGDGMCNGTETCTSCARDCGACPPSCGDGMCNGTETCTNCARDCGACPNPCNATSCSACTENSACLWCRTTLSCVQAAGSTCADRVTSPSACSVTPPINITTSCTSTTTTAETNCGFRTVQSMSCTPGTTLTFGCTGGADAGACGFSGGTCVGDPILRVCPGLNVTGCAYADRVMPMNPGVSGVTADDDGCGLCPWVRVACPSAGAITIFTRAYNLANSASCTVVFR